MAVVRYIDQDPGDAPYLTRILVTPDFMRDNQLAMVFTAGTVPPKPASRKPRLDIRKAAHGTQRFSLAVNGVVCSEGLAVQRAPDAARAMVELKSVLAATQYRVWQTSPREMQHDCDLANLVWASGATLELGLPLEEREFSGRTRQLESESKQPLQPELFRVPDGMTAIDAPS
jgi:hypothetical protein